MEGPGSSFGPTLGVSPACEGELDEEAALAAGCIVKGQSKPPFEKHKEGVRAPEHALFSSSHFFAGTEHRDA